MTVKINNFDDIKNIAVVRTDKLGDMVLTLPMFPALRESFPKSKLSLIASRYVSSLCENQPDIDNVFYLGDFQNGIRDIFKNNKFDLVFFPRPRFNEIFYAFLNRTKFRSGSAYRWYSFLFNQKVKDHRKISDFHESEYNIRMISQITGKNYNVKLLKPYIFEHDKLFINELLFNNGISSDQKVAIIHPGSGGSSRELPISKFLKIATFLEKELNLRIILTGTKNEKKACSLIASGCLIPLNLCERINMGQMIALIDKSYILISNSTGILHISSATGIRTVGFYPNTPHLSKKRWGPYSELSRVFTPPEKEGIEYNDDMASIKVDTALEVIKNLCVNVV